MKNIYEYMNEIKTDLKQYNEEELTEIDVKCWEKRLKKQIHRKNLKRNLAGAACVMVCLAALLAGPFRNEVQAAMDSASEALELFILTGTKDGDIKPYETVVNTTKESDGIKVTLESVVLDEDEMVLSTMQESPEMKKSVETNSYGIGGGFKSFNQMKEQMSKDLKKDLEAGKIPNPILAAEVYINGRKADCDLIVIDPSGEEDGKNRVLYTFNKTKGRFDLDAQTDIELKFEEVTGRSSGKWKFAFQADGKQLAATSKEVNLNVDVLLSDQGKIQLTGFRHTAISTYLYFSGELNKEYYIELRGKNDRGESVKFYAYQRNKDGGSFKLNSWNTVRAEDAKSMTLTPYYIKISDYPDGNWKESDIKRFGEEFKINLE